MLISYLYRNQTAPCSAQGTADNPGISQSGFSLFRLAFSTEDSDSGMDCVAGKLNSHLETIRRFEMLKNQPLTTCTVSCFSIGGSLESETEFHPCRISCAAYNLIDLDVTRSHSSACCVADVNIYRENPRFYYVPREPCAR